MLITEMLNRVTKLFEQRSQQIKLAEHDSIELMRIIAAFLIVWYHSEVALAHDISYSGLIMFVVFSVYLGVRSSKPGLRFKSRVIRLMIPWAFWSFFYGLGNVIFSKPFFPSGGNYLTAILAGSYVHLWYLPFIFIVLIINDFFKQIFSERVGTYTAFVLCTLVLLSSDYWRPVSLEMESPLPQYFHAIPAVLIGILFGAIHIELSSKIKTLILVVIILSVFTMIDIKGLGLPYLIGTVAVLVSIYAPIKLPYSSLISKTAANTYGVYLVHPIFLFIFNRFGIREIFPLVAFVSTLCSVHYFRQLFPKVSKYIL